MLKVSELKQSGVKMCTVQNLSFWQKKLNSRRPNDRSLHYFGTILPRENVTRNLIFAFSLKIVARRYIIRGKGCQEEIGPD